MAGETGAIEIMAKYVSSEIFDWFKWSRVKLPDQNFECVKPENHAPKKSAKHTHPVDVVFHYHDPYLNKDIYLNTDLKSYAAGSIQSSNIVAALKSLAHTIDCSRVSEEWLNRYILNQNPHEIRGLLFVYNHDADYDKSFYEVLSEPVKGRGKADPKPARLDTIPVQDGQSLHIAEPSLINYLSSIIADANRLHAAGTFPETEYEFFYPELKLHKTSGEKNSRPATMEMLAGPYLIIRHEKVVKYNEKTAELEERYPEGYLIYYHRNGASAEEFAYFFDILSGMQILDGNQKIRIRQIAKAPASDPLSNFKRGIELYAKEWNFDKYKLQRLHEIEFEPVTLARYSFSRTVIGWDR